MKDNLIMDENNEGLNCEIACKSGAPSGVLASKVAEPTKRIGDLRKNSDGSRNSSRSSRHSVNRDYRWCRSGKSSVEVPDKMYDKSVTVEYNSDNDRSCGRNKYQEFSKQSTLNVDNNDEENATECSSVSSNSCGERKREGYVNTRQKTCKRGGEQSTEHNSSTDDMISHNAIEENEVKMCTVNEVVTCQKNKNEKEKEKEPEEGNLLKLQQNDSVFLEKNDKNVNSVLERYEDISEKNLDMNWNKSQIKTCIRIKPLDSVGNNLENVITQRGLNKILINYGVQSENKKCEFVVDRIFNEESTQSDIWKSICFCIDSVFHFKNATVFAHGHTGTGKTYTMIGPDVMELIKGKKRKIRHSGRRMQPIELLLNTNSLRVPNGGGSASGNGNSNSNSSSNNFLYERKRSCSQPIFNFPARVMPLVNGNYCSYKKMYDSSCSAQCNGAHTSANSTGNSIVNSIVNSGMNSGVSSGVNGGVSSGANGTKNSSTNMAPNGPLNARHNHKMNAECMSESTYYGKYENCKTFSEYRMEYKPNVKHSQEEIRLILDSDRKGMIPRACEEIMRRLSLQRGVGGETEVHTGEKGPRGVGRESGHLRGDLRSGRSGNFSVVRDTHAEKTKDVFKNVKVYASYMQLYNDRIFDLLNPCTEPQPYLSTQKSKLYNNATFVSGLLTVEVANCEELIELLVDGTSNRACRITKTNEMSTRSHSIFKVELRYVNHSKPEFSKSGNLLLIDLAGNEKYAASNEKLYTTEVCSINRSLSALSLCINELSKGNKNISYRNSILTRLLQDSLGGSSKTVFICTISSCMKNVRDTLSSLKLVSRAKKIQVESRGKNVYVYEEDIRRLQKELYFLKKFVFFQYITNRYESRKRLRKIREFYFSNFLDQGESSFQKSCGGSADVIPGKNPSVRWGGRSIPDDTMQKGNTGEEESNHCDTIKVDANEEDTTYAGIESIYKEYERKSFNSLLYQWNLNKGSIRKARDPAVTALTALNGVNSKRNPWFHGNGNVNRKNVMNFIETHTIEYEVDSDEDLFSGISNDDDGEEDDEADDEGEEYPEDDGECNGNDDNRDESDRGEDVGRCCRVDGDYEKEGSDTDEAYPNEEMMKGGRKSIEIFPPRDDSRKSTLEEGCKRRTTDGHVKGGDVMAEEVVAKRGKKEDTSVSGAKGEDEKEKTIQTPCNGKELSCSKEKAREANMLSVNAKNLKKSGVEKNKCVLVSAERAVSVWNIPNGGTIPKRAKFVSTSRNIRNPKRSRLKAGKKSLFLNFAMHINKRKGTSGIFKNRGEENKVRNGSELNREKEKIGKCCKVQKQGRRSKTWKNDEDAGFNIKVKGAYCRRKGYAELVNSRKSANSLQMCNGSNLSPSDGIIGTSISERGGHNSSYSSSAHGGKIGQSSGAPEKTPIGRRNCVKQKENQTNVEGDRQVKSIFSSEGSQVVKKYSSNETLYRKGRSNAERGSPGIGSDIENLLQLGDSKMRQHYLSNVGIKNMVINRINILPNSKVVKNCNEVSCGVKNKDTPRLKGEKSLSEVRKREARAGDGVREGHGNISDRNNGDRGRSISENCCFSNWKNKTIIGQNGKGKFSYYIEFNKINDVKKYFMDGHTVRGGGKGDTGLTVRNGVVKNMNKNSISQVEEKWLDFEKKLETKLGEERDGVVSGYGGSSVVGSRIGGDKSHPKGDSEMSALEENKKKLDKLKNRYEKIVAESQKRDSRNAFCLRHSVGDADKGKDNGGYRNGTTYPTGGSNARPQVRNGRSVQDMQRKALEMRKTDLFGADEQVTPTHMIRSGVTFKGINDMSREERHTYENAKVVGGMKSDLDSMISSTYNIQDMIKASYREKKGRFFLRSHFSGADSGMEKHHRDDLVSKLHSFKNHHAENRRMDGANPIGRVVYLPNGGKLHWGKKHCGGAEQVNLNGRLIYIKGDKARIASTYANVNDKAGGLDKHRKNDQHHLASVNTVDAYDSIHNVGLERKASPNGGVSNCVLLNTHGNETSWGRPTNGVLLQGRNNPNRVDGERGSHQIGKEKINRERYSENKFREKYFLHGLLHPEHLPLKDNSMYDDYYESRKMHKANLFAREGGSKNFDVYTIQEGEKMRNGHYGKGNRIHREGFQVNPMNSVIPYRSKSIMNGKIKNVHYGGRELPSGKFVVRSGFTYGERSTKDDPLPPGQDRKTLRTPPQMRFQDVNRNEINQFRVIPRGGGLCAGGVYGAGTSR
ncbi:kinesin-19, putative [Plasmodium knowlesi strain H]|uniref:Kinesin-19, putative n=3 Tax=Plasmodium knowlesi TaxID=5850 RepID=A0A5K1UTG4_PLAKH|nr:kinesin-19, putative [Plasmodium knowlesi strain H]OTN68536.1 putative Kinesin-19 [Plasmodium knowlesi]CAA9986628.1 kinesin-19, putative [Plasmodium knowlesi strain H]SBO24093.1 kinesin-19, putative [Plasmodium knowlesi strain H]SBO29338.1 kinesin-19, putative [Plasmodium knowlesi strain H]VVS76102.1 kinesin-19, putative [Plasmodium knowlesi strain H]|eukprot:XP_002261168.1 kinesin-like protein, putative [Plasmodium knowlesi strain H]